MKTHPRQGFVSAPGSPNFALHTLGWRAFQDLAATVLREVLGQSVQTFADSNDGGRDGAFYGTWRPDGKSMAGDLPAAPFVLQCKHTRKADSTLAPSDLKDEFSKVRTLVARGLCHSYILLTNARVSGESEATIRESLLKAGVASPMVLDGQWISDTIAAHQPLRALVPRVYGLGDISQILDERAYNQAGALLDYLQDDLSTFVATDAYTGAVAALRSRGFVLLLGAPGVGKSVIAQTLAMTAVDAWGCLPIKAESAADLVNHWNPHESQQFFWVDDAFGMVRHERSLTDSWARLMSQVMTAVHKGARIVLTSRDYIYREARPFLKESSYPLLHEQQVVIDVAELPRKQRQLILYSHLRRGDQPPAVRTAMKPHLLTAADADPFYPEVARRLGKQAFTGRLKLTRPGITDFMSRPSEFLREVYAGLDADEQSALALTYQAGAFLPAPLDLDPVQVDVMTRLGGSASGVSQALRTLDGTFLRQGSPFSDSTVTGWSFRHPTLQEGFAEFLAADPNLIKILISGSNWQTILSRIDCATGDQHLGTLLRVPPALHSKVVEVIQMAEYETRRDWISQRIWHDFLAERCSNEFLTLYMQEEPDFVSRMTNFPPLLNTASEPRVLARLKQAGLIRPKHHARIVQHVARLAVQSADAGWTWLPEWKVLLSDDEREQLLIQVKEKLPPHFDQVVREWGMDFDPDESDAHSHYDELLSNMHSYQAAFEGDDVATSIVDRMIEKLEEVIWATDDEQAKKDHSDMSPIIRPVLSDDKNQRDIFDDIDE